MFSLLCTQTTKAAAWKGTAALEFPVPSMLLAQAGIVFM